MSYWPYHSDEVGVRRSHFPKPDPRFEGHPLQGKVWTQLLVVPLLIAVASLSGRAALAQNPIPDQKITIISGAGVHASTFFEASLPRHAIGVITGGLRGHAEAWPALLEAGGWEVVGAEWNESLEPELQQRLISNREESEEAVVFHQVGDRKLALISVTLPPEGQPTTGWQDPEQAISRALAMIEDDATVILIASTNREQAANILRRVPGIALCIVSGLSGGSPVPLNINGAWLVEAPWGGSHWGVTELYYSDGKPDRVEHRVELPRGESFRVAQAKRAHGLDSPTPDTLVRSVSPSAPVSLADPFTGNRACILRLHGKRISSHYGSFEPGDSRVLVLDISIENVIPLTLVQDLEISTIYRFANLADHVYVIVNGHRTARIPPEARQLPGHIKISNFSLERLGERQRGNLVFKLPPGEIHSLELRVYDYAHGHMQMMLTSDTDPLPSTTVAQIRPPATNEIVTAAIHEISTHHALGESQAPAGMTFVSIDLRARSMFSFETDATAFNPHAEPGEKIDIGTVADWLEAHKYTHLIVDNEYAYTPDPELTDLPSDPRFLPDLMTGGRVVFPVPEDFETLVLRADFPNARMPDGKVIRPQPLHFTLRGEPGEPSARESIWRVEDDTIEVSLSSLSVTENFAGQEAGKDRIFLIVEATVRAFGDKPDFFQTREQLRYVDARGRQHPPHPATFRGIRRPVDNVWVPNGEQRSFQLAYLIDRAEAHPRLAYRGFSLAEIIELPRIDEEIQVAEISAVTEATTDKPLVIEEDVMAADEPPQTDTAVEEDSAETASREKEELPGRARIRVIKEDEIEPWVREQNRNGVNLALRQLGTVMVTDGDFSESSLPPIHNGRVDTSVRLEVGRYRLELAGEKPPVIHQVAVAASRWTKQSKLTVEAADGQGGYIHIATLQGLESQPLCLRVMDFDPIETREIRFALEQLDGRGSGARFFEIMVMEGPLADKSESVLSGGGMNISRLEHGGSIFHTFFAVNHLTNPPDDGHFRLRRGRGDQETWSEPITLAFQANRSALVKAVELWPALREDHRTQLPGQIRITASVAEPFEGYRLIGEYDVEASASPWRIDFSQPVPARFLRVQFKPREGNDGLSIGELVVREGTEPGYQSVLIRGDGIQWRMREQPRLIALLGQDAANLRRIEAVYLDENTIDLDLNDWLGSILDRAGQRHLFRVRVDYDNRTEIPELQLHMAPFLRGRVRILNQEGAVVETPEPERQAGTSLIYPLSVDPGEYLVELTSAPIYLFMGFDTSASMGRALPITRTSLPDLLADLPEGVYVALASSLRNPDTRKHLTLFTPYSRDGEVLKQANEELFDARGGGSDWYNFLRDMLEWADDNIPPDGIGAKVLVADGVGSGDYDTMWDRLHITKQRLYTVGWGSQTLRLDHVDASTGWTAARGLFNVAWYCNGRYFEPQADHELVETYKTILRDVQTPAEYALRIHVRKRQSGQLATSKPPERESHPILFVLDASGSMMIELEGRTRLAVAQEVIERVVNTLPNHARVGLRVYGHRYRAIGAERDRAATDSELLIPIGPLNRAAFIRTVRNINARGATPLAHTIEQIPRDLRGVSDPLVVILTDGVESFRRNPVLKSRQLKEARPDLEYVVVGFMIDRMVDRENLRGMAEAGQGTYYNAMDSASLVHSLEQAINPTIEYQVFDWQGREVASGTFGDSHELVEGEYQMRATMYEGSTTVPLTIRAGRTVQVAESDLPEADPLTPSAVDATEVEAAPAPSPVPPRFCTGCGQRLAEDARFCTGCGTPVR